MKESYPNDPATLKDKFLFSFQLFVCIFGSIVILLFAIGLEIGHPVSDRLLNFAINNMTFILISSVVICLWIVLPLILKPKNKKF